MKGGSRPAPTCHPKRKHMGRGLCSRCYSREYAKGRRAADEHYDRRKRLELAYGLTLEQYDQMLTLQDGHCALCPSKPKSRRLDVDHDHKTKRVRGLLCFVCNKILVGKHTTETVQKVLAYLESDFDGRRLHG